MSKKISVRQRVWSLLCAGLENYENGEKWFYFLGADGCQYDIQMHDGFIPQSYFADPKIVGSTEGKRRLRCGKGEFQDEPWFREKYFLEGRWFRWGYGYRLRRKQQPEDWKRVVSLDFGFSERSKVI